MRRRSLAIVFAASLAAAGCLGLGAGGEEAGVEQQETPPDGEDARADEEDPAEGTNATGGGSAGNASAHGPYLNATYRGSARANAPVIDPGQQTGAKAAFVRASYENGLNGTWVLGYEVSVEEGSEALTVETSPSYLNQSPRPVPDYDLFVYGPGGDMLSSSYEQDAEERVVVRDPEAGDHLVALVLVWGADAPVTTHVTAR